MIGKGRESIKQGEGQIKWERGRKREGNEIDVNLSLIWHKATIITHVVRGKFTCNGEPD